MRYLFLIIVISPLVLFSCKKEKEDLNISDIPLSSSYLYEIMDEAYFWNTSMPENPDLNKNPFELLEDLRYKPIDKWSYITTTEQYNSYFVQGTFEGYGFGHEPDQEGNVRISLNVP